MARCVGRNRRVCWWRFDRQRFIALHSRTRVWYRIDSLRGPQLTRLDPQGIGIIPWGMLSLFIVALAAIAAHRLWNYETLFAPLRDKLSKLPYPLGKIFGCPPCNGVWIAILFVGLAQLYHPVLNVVLTGLALYPFIRALVWVYTIGLPRFVAPNSLPPALAPDKTPQHAPTPPKPAAVASAPTPPALPAPVDAASAKAAETCQEKEARGEDSPCAQKQRALREEVEHYRTYKKRVVIMTALHNFDPSYSLTSVILDQAIAISKTHADWAVVLMVMHNCKDPQIELPKNVLVKKVIPSVPFRTDEIHEPSVKLLTQTIRNQLLHLGNATIITHDLLFVSQFLTFAEAIHTIGDMKGFSWYHTCHSAPGRHIDHPKVKARYTLPAGDHNILALTPHQAKGLKEYYVTDKEPVVVPNIRDMRTYPRPLPDALFSFITQHKLLESDIVQVYPISTTRFAAKGLDLLIHVFAQLEKLYTVRLVIVNPHANGKDAVTTLAAYRALADRVGLSQEALVFTSQTIPGTVANGISAEWVHALYRCANLFVFPTWSEACPLILQEALMHRIPTLVNSDAAMLPPLAPSVKAIPMGRSTRAIPTVIDNTTNEVIKTLSAAGEPARRRDLQVYGLTRVAGLVTALVEKTP